MQSIVSAEGRTPWPTRGLPRIALPLGNRIHEISPRTEIWIDTWHLNHPTFGGKDWKNLVDSLDSTKQRPAWFAGFEVGVAPKHGFARMSAEERDHYNKARQPLISSLIAYGLGQSTDSTQDTTAGRHIITPDTTNLTVPTWLRLTNFVSGPAVDRASVLAAPDQKIGRAHV